MSRIEDAIGKALKKRQSEISADSGAHSRTENAHVYLQQKEPAIINRNNDNLMVLNEPDSFISEEYRKLKSLIVKFSKENEEFRNTFIVTSALGAEGKSLTALNLALSLSQEYDHTVLLVDTDIRKPSLHKYLGLEPSFGITECLTEGVDVADALIRTDIGKLSFLPAGKKIGNPVELLASFKMRDLIEEIRSRYSDRYIIFDTPPILPFAETRTLSSMVDGVIFVIKEGLAPSKGIKEALGFLKANCNILGIVYNGATTLPRKTDYYAY